MNELVLDGEIIRSEEPRFTPSGLQVFEGILHHSGDAVVDDSELEHLHDETLVVAYGEVAAKLYQLPLPARITLKGYITPRSSRTQRLIVYITEFS